MYLFILESIGTSELILIGIVALMFLGPRKMPEMARKIGKMMADFRNTTNEFKETWNKEVNVEDEIKAFTVDDIDEKPVARINTTSYLKNSESLEAPEIKEIDPASFHNVPEVIDSNGNDTDEGEPESEGIEDINDKRNWL